MWIINHCQPPCTNFNLMTKILIKQPQILTSLHKIYHSFKNLRIRHRIASEIQVIKSRMGNISEEYNKYHNSANESEKGSSSSGSGIRGVSSQVDAFFLGKVDHVVGINEPKSQIIEWLLSNYCERTVVSVVGMGGLGKTTLVKQVYDDPIVKKYFKIYVWLTVSQSFKIEELFRDMVRKLCTVIKIPVPQAVDSSDELPEMIERLLQRSRYLIVLDDVWHLEVWNTIKHALPDNKRGSPIILTTRHFGVASASSIESQGEIYKLEPLADEDSWDLFCKKTFKGKPCPDHLLKFCRIIVKKCGGFPLAIVTVSGVLARKDRRNIDEWEMVSRNLVSQIEDHGNLAGLRNVFSISFNDLPYYLKSCFLYLSIFPEDHLIEHKRLIRLWIAEGFVTDEENMTLEEVGESYLKELINRNLIQVAETTTDGRIKTYRIHDLLHEFILLKSREQSFVTVITDGGVMTWPEKVRCLSLLNRQELVQQSKTNFQLRSFIVFEVVDTIAEFSLKKMIGDDGSRLLTVLDLQAAPLEKFPKEIVELLHLKYLSLRSTKVKHIPNSIGKLQNLETLDLEHTNVSELPAKILKLKKLRHLLVYRYMLKSYAHSKTGFKALDKIGSLQALQRLCFIEVSQNSSSIMKEVEKMHQLRKLGILDLKREDGVFLCSAIEKLTNLRALSITSSKEDEIIDFDHLASPPQFLQRLYLRCKLEKLPHWIPSLHSLVKVYLKWSHLKVDPLEGLQELPNLVHLEFLEACDSETLQFGAGKFQSLKLLGLDKLDNLRKIKVEEGAMPCLETLIIQRCSLLQRVPMGVEGLSQLKVLSLFDMPEQLIDTLRSDREQDYWKVKHISEVYSTYWNNEFGIWNVYSIESGFQDSVDTHRQVPIMRFHSATLSET